MTRVKECVLYRGFEHGDILDKMTALMDASERAAVNASEMEEEFYECVNGGKDELDKVYKFSIAVTHVYCFFALVISFFSKEVLYLMVSQEYRETWIYVQFLVFGCVFHGLYFFFVNVLFLKHTSCVFVITLTSMVLSVFLNIILIPILGLIGCIIAFFLTYFFRSLIALIISMIKNKIIRFPWRRMYLLVFLFLLLSCGSYLFVFSFWTNVLIKLMISSFVVILFMFNYKNEIVAVYAVFKNRKKREFDR